MTPIKGYEIYSINLDGTIIINNNPDAKKKTIKISNHFVNKKPSGYKYATLLNDRSELKRITIHRLVALTFIPNPLNLPEIIHKDNNKTNNNFSNLEWTTHQNNIIQSFKNGRTVKSGKDSILFGKKASIKTKSLMAKMKIGTKHPKYKGYFVINGKRFNSCRHAAAYTGIDYRTIKKRCNDKKFSKEYTFVPKQTNI